MSDWRNNIKGDPIPWLLEPDVENPGVRYFALLDLLDTDQDDPKVQAAHRAVMNTGPVPAILEAQDPEVDETARFRRNAQALRQERGPLHVLEDHPQERHGVRPGARHGHERHRRAQRPGHRPSHLGVRHPLPAHAAEHEDRRALDGAAVDVDGAFPRRVGQEQPSILAWLRWQRE